MTYQAVVLEDDAQAASTIVSRIEQSPYASELSVAHVTSAQELAVHFADAGRPDILFADIELGEGEASGIQSVRKLVPFGCGTQVIYITGYAEYCVSVYETEHVYLLLKPVDQMTFNKALKRAISNLQTRQEQMLAVSFKNQTTLVPFEDICYVESRLRKVIVHTADESFETYATLADMITALPASFLRCHKSFLVNMDLIVRMEAGELTVRSGEVIPVGQRYREEVKGKLATYFGMLRGGALNPSKASAVTADRKRTS